MAKKQCFVQLAIALGALGMSGIAVAVPNPNGPMDDSPEVLKCAISEVTADEGDEVSVYTANCAVIEVVRTTTAVEAGHNVRIAYQVNHAAFRSQDGPPIPGPAYPTPPPKLVNGQTVVAYLRSQGAGDGKQIYLPSAGMDSFQVVPPRDNVPLVSRCRDAGDAGPIMANEKACAEDALKTSEAEMSDVYAGLHARLATGLEESKQAEDQSAVTVLSGQLDALRDSQAAWVNYRNKTCRLAYFQYYPGSLARLEELVCLNALTGKRTEQLRNITENSGDEPIRY